MPESIQRVTGRTQAWTLNKGNNPTDVGVFSGIVMNNVDSTRAGRLEVYIAQFATGNKDDPRTWRTVRPLQQQGGSTPQTSSSTGAGSYGTNNNQQSYGSASGSPDIGTEVLCTFLGGDPSLG